MKKFLGLICAVALVFEMVNMAHAKIQIAAGAYHTVGLKSDGTVVAVGDNDDGQCNIDSWTDISQVAAGLLHTVGLKSDGTVVAVGDYYGGRSWTDIIQIAAGYNNTVGLKSDGTVMAVGENDDGQCNIDSWTDISQVAAGWYHTVGLKSDGTVVAVGYGSSGQCDVGSWADIIQIAAGYNNTIGLKSDGTVVAVGVNSYGRCEVGSWTDIIQVAARSRHIVGLKSDGTVVAVGRNSYSQCEVGSWTNIIQIAAGGSHTVGLKSDGTVVAVGDNRYGQCEVGSWTLIVYYVNRLPILDQIGPQQIKEGEFLQLIITAKDSDGDELTYSVNNLPDGASFNPNTQEFKWEPNHNQAGSYEVTFIVTDNGTPPLSDSETITIYSGFKPQMKPDIALTEQGGLIVWQDLRNGELANTNIPQIAGQQWFYQGSEIYGLLLDPNNGAPATENAGEIQIGTPNKNQFNPRVAGFDMRFLVVWEDLRNGERVTTGSFPGYENKDIYGQIIDIEEPNNRTQEFAIATYTMDDPDDPSYLDQSNPAVATSGDNRFLVVWDDGINGPCYGRAIYGAIVSYDPNAGPKVHQDVARYWFESCIIRNNRDNTHPAVAWANNARKYLVVWQNCGTKRLYANSLDPNGQVMGGWNILLNRAADKEDNSEIGNPICITRYTDMYSPAIASDGDRFLIVWEHEEEGVLLDKDIYGIFVNPNCIVISIDPNGLVTQKLQIDSTKPGFIGNAKIPICTAKGDQTNPRVHWDKATGNYFVVWTSQPLYETAEGEYEPGSDTDIQVAWLNANGQLVGRETEDSGWEICAVQGIQKEPVISGNGNIKRAAWTDARNNGFPRSSFIFDGLSSDIYSSPLSPILDSIGGKTVDEGVLLQFSITAIDPDEDDLIYSASNLPIGASFDPDTQAFSWRPSYNQAGSYEVTFIVTDDGTPPLCDSETITIKVINKSRPSSYDSYYGYGWNYGWYTQGYQYWNVPNYQQLWNKHLLSNWNQPTLQQWPNLPQTWQQQSWNQPFNFQAYTPPAPQSQPWFQQQYQQWDFTGYLQLPLSGLWNWPTNNSDFTGYQQQIFDFQKQQQMLNLQQKPWKPIALPSYTWP